MKKMIFSTAAIAIGFIVFSFAPIKKSDAFEKAEITTTVTKGGSCDTKYETDHTFTKCQERWTIPPSGVRDSRSQSSVLENL